MPYTIRKVITIDPTLVGGSNLTGFWMVFRGTYSYLATLAHGGQVTSGVGDDIVFTDSGGVTVIDFERVFYDPLTGTVEFWVLVAAVSASVGSVINLLAGNSAIVSYQGTTATWAAAGGIYHFPDGSLLTANDSSPNANHAALFGAPTAVAGQIDGAAHFTTQNVDYASAPDAASLHLAPPFTISAWVKLDSHSTGNTQIIAARNSGSNINYDFYIDGGASGRPTFFYSNGATNVFLQDSTGTVGLSAWTHVAVVVTLGATPHADFYVNGSFTSTQTSFVSLPSVGAGALFMGGDSGGNPVLKGALDELHLIPTNLSAGWIRAEYNNQFSPATFYTITSASAYSESATAGLSLGGAFTGTLGISEGAGVNMRLAAACDGAVGYGSPAAGCNMKLAGGSGSTMAYNSPAGTVPLRLGAGAVTSIGTVPITCLTGDGTGAAVIPPGVDPGWAY